MSRRTQLAPLLNLRAPNSIIVVRVGMLSNDSVSYVYPSCDYVTWAFLANNVLVNSGLGSHFEYTLRCDTHIILTVRTQRGACSRVGVSV